MTWPWPVRIWHFVLMTGEKRRKNPEMKKNSTDIATTDIAPKYDFWRMIKNQNPKNSEKE